MDIEDDKGKQGLKTAVAELHDPSKPPVEPVVQMQLPELPLDSALEAWDIAPKARGRGRPPGAKNKSTEEWREYLLTRGQSPLVVLQQTFSMSVGELALALGKTGHLTFDQALELYKLQIMAAKELAPYLHSKMPQAVDVGGEGGLIQLVINHGAAARQGVQDAGGAAFQVLNTPDEENQLVTDADFVDTAQSRHNGELNEPEGTGK